MTIITPEPKPNNTAATATTDASEVDKAIIALTKEMNDKERTGLLPFEERSIWDAAQYEREERLTRLARESAAAPYPLPEHHRMMNILLDEMALYGEKEA